MSFTLTKSAALSAVLFAVASVPAVATDTITDWANDVREEFVSKQRYPRLALNANEEGTVTVRVSVAASGAVNGFEIIETSGSEALDAGALDLVSRIDPLPAVPTGEAHAFIIPLSYKIADERNSAKKTVSAQAQNSIAKWRQSVERIVAGRQVYPAQLLAKGVEGSVKVRLDVAADGSILDSQVIQSSGHAKLDEEALLMAANLDLPTLPTEQEGFTVILPLKYEIAGEDHTFVRR